MNSFHKIFTLYEITQYDFILKSLTQIFLNISNFSNKSIKRSVSNDRNFTGNKVKYNSRLRQHKSQADLKVNFAQNANETNPSKIY